MTFAINDAPGHLGSRGNCSLVTAAALRSHRTGAQFTSGEYIKQMWIAAADKHKRTGSSAMLANIPPTGFNQTLDGVHRLNLTTHKFEEGDLFPGLYPEEDPSLNMRNFLTATRGNPGIEALNERAAEIVVEELEQFPGTQTGAVLTREGAPALAIVKFIAGIKEDTLFALHCYSLGHWQLGYASSDPTTFGIQNPWYLRFKKSLVFLDYQKEAASWSFYPHMGASPNVTPYVQPNDSNDVYIVRASPNAAGLPSNNDQHSGYVDVHYEGLLHPEVKEAFLKAEAAKAAAFEEAERAASQAASASTSQASEATKAATEAELDHSTDFAK